MDEIKLAIQIDPSSKKKVEAMAHEERRSIEDQAAYLMEKGLLILERQQTQVEAGMAGDCFRKQGPLGP
jgi:hypothetical protein